MVEVNVAEKPQAGMASVGSKPKLTLVAKEDVLAVFLADKAGSLEGSFTRAILCRNELNHLGHSSSTPTSKNISLPQDCLAEMKPFECRGGTKFGYKLVVVPKF